MRSFGLIASQAGIIKSTEVMKMVIYKWVGGELKGCFSTLDEEAVEQMCKDLDDPENDTVEYNDRDDRLVAGWRDKKGQFHGA